jgi:hypothetical protein
MRGCIAGVASRGEMGRSHRLRMMAACAGWRCANPTVARSITFVVLVA